MPEMIDTSTMPGDMMDPDAIEGAAGKLRSVGSQVSTQGGTVLTSWQKISASYDAPEEHTLFHAMNPVKTAAEKVGTDTGSAATALETFAEEVRTIKAAVAQIRQEAAAFKADVAGGVEKKTYSRAGVSTHTIEWHEDQASVDKNNDLISRTNDQQEALWKAERTCANAIRALVGLGPISAMSESNPNGYGVDSIPDGTDMPWGSKVERTESCGEEVVHGVANGVGGLVSGVAGLVGFRYTGDGLWDHWDWDWDWSWGNMGESWAGLGKFALGAATTGLVTTPIVMTMPGPVGDFLRDSQKTFAGGVAGLVAIDIYADDPLHKWKEHGWRALGESGFNIATIVVPATKVGNLGKVGRVGEVALNVTDPLYLATKAAQGVKVLAGPTVENLLRIERGLDLETGMRISRDIDVDIPAVNRDGVNVDLPNTHVPDVHVPDVHVPDVHVPDVHSPDVHAPDVDVPPARDLPETPDRNGSDEAPQPAPSSDHQPAPVGTHNGEVSGSDGPLSGHADGNPATDPVSAHTDPNGSTTDSVSTHTESGSENSAGTHSDSGSENSAGTHSDAPGSHDGDHSPSGETSAGHEDATSEGSTGGGTDLSSGLAHRGWEDTSHGYGPDTQVMGDKTAPVDFKTTNSNDLGRYGEALTKQDLVDRGYRIVIDQAQIRLPGGKFFKPDFIAIAPDGQVVLVESKMGAGAKFTPNQDIGYDHYAPSQSSQSPGAQPALVGRSVNTDYALQQAFLREGITGRVRVSRVEVYRWNTEIVPSDSLLSRANVPK